MRPNYRISSCVTLLEMEIRMKRVMWKAGISDTCALCTYADAIVPRNDPILFGEAEWSVVQTNVNSLMNRRFYAPCTLYTALTNIMTYWSFDVHKCMQSLAKI